MLITQKHQTGFTLLELLIGSLMGLIVAASGIALFIVGLQGQGDNLKLARLNQDLRAMMDIMVRDIRRAGFVTSNINNVSQLKGNPFFSTTSGSSTELRVYASNFTTSVIFNTSDSGTNAGPCMVYSYNEDDDNPPVVDSNERYGFRYNATSNVVEMRRGATTHNDDCNDGTWVSITEPEVEITALSFRPVEKALNITSMQDGSGDDDGDGFCDSGEGCNTCDLTASPVPACLYIRVINIELTGRLRDNSNINQTITSQIRIRNDKFVDAP